MIKTGKKQQYQLFLLLKKVSLFLMDHQIHYLFLFFERQSDPLQMYDESDEQSDEYSNSFHVELATR